jgi:L-alanine-DL-glutamate epimerase-like enolase superfamily enzyme
MLQSSLRTPIMLDQSVMSLSHAEQAIDLGSCHRMRIDIARVGGITPAVAIRDACRATNIPCGVGGGPSSEVAASAAAALAATCDLPLASEAYQWDMHALRGSVAPARNNSAGRYEITLHDDVPGWGVLPGEEFFAAKSIERATIG